MIVYAATFMEKTVEADSYEKGCIGPRRCIMQERLNVESFSLAGLIATLSEQFDLDLEDVFVPGIDPDEITHIGYNRLENDEGYEPGPIETAEWKRGKVTLYLADYTFAIEKRETLPIKTEEFATAGITTH